MILTQKSTYYQVHFLPVNTLITTYQDKHNKYKLFICQLCSNAECADFSTLIRKKGPVSALFHYIGVDHCLKFIQILAHICVGKFRHGLIDILQFLLIQLRLTMCNIGIHLLHHEIMQPII